MDSPKSGFANLEQLNAWFSPGDRKLLNAAGFKTALYSLPKESVLSSEIQIIFDYATCQTLDYLELN